MATDTPILYALPDAAKALGRVSVWTLRKHQQMGNLRVTRIGRRVFLDVEELERIRREGLPSLRANAASFERQEEPCPR